MSIGSNIRKRRFELKMSQQELADKLNYKDRSTIAKIESDKNDVSHGKLLRFARALDTTVDYLLSGTGLDSTVPQWPALPDESKDHRNIAVILAGGDSNHNNQNVPNQFINIQGKPIFMYACETYQRHPAIDAIYIVCLKGWDGIVTAYAREFLISKLKAIVPGGSTGIRSVRNAVTEIAKNYDDKDTVIFQESTRPLVTTELISNLLNKCDRYSSIITCAPMDDYVQFLLEEKSQRYIDRYRITNVQSPDAHKLGYLKQAFADERAGQNDFQESGLALFLHNLGKRLKFYEGPHNNVKIFREEDLAIFAGLLKTHMY